MTHFKNRWRDYLGFGLFLFLTDLYVRVATIISIGSIKNWIEEPKIVVPIMSMIIYAIITIFFLGLFNRVRLACILTVLLMTILSIAQWMKLSILGVPIYPWDIILVSEAVNVFDIKVLWHYWSNLVFLALIVILFYKIWKWIPMIRFSPSLRAVFFIIPIAFIALTFSPTYSPLRPWRNDIMRSEWTQNVTYDRAGLGLALLANLQYFFIPQPELPYDKKIIHDILKPYATRTTMKSLHTKINKINVIFILSEAFWDVTQLQDSVHFDSDPIPTIHEMEREFGSINLISPVYGGRTPNAEFEMLTGLSMLLFPKDTVPYKHYIRKNIESVVTTLKDNGYYTVMTCATTRSYFNDFQIYPLLGYNQFINAKQWTVKPTYRDYSHLSKIVFERVPSIR